MRSLRGLLATVFVTALIGGTLAAAGLVPEVPARRDRPRGAGYDIGAFACRKPD